MYGNLALPGWASELIFQMHFIFLRSVTHSDLCGVSHHKYRVFSVFLFYVNVFCRSELYLMSVLLWNMTTCGRWLQIVLGRPE